MPIFFKPKKYEGSIAAVRDESRRVKLFTIQLPDKSFSFVPGMNVVLSLPSVLNEKGMPLKRVYSIASAPSTDGTVEVCVAVKPAPSFSAELAGRKAGEKITVEGPFGIFQLREPIVDRVILIAGGTGIAPLLSMIRHLVKKGEKEMLLLFGFRTEDDFLYRRELEGYAGSGKIRLVTSMSGGEWANKGRITDFITANLGKPVDTYICGPQQMVADSRKKLLELGWTERHIIYEQWE